MWPVPDNVPGTVTLMGDTKPHSMFVKVGTCHTRKGVEHAEQWRRRRAEEQRGYTHLIYERTLELVSAEFGEVDRGDVIEDSR